MNDFTKEELEEIIEWMYEAEAEHSVHAEKVLEHNPLYRKIQSMIDNYCDHKKYVENLVTGFVCEKCGKPEDE
jgi:hypothetical protein